MFNQENIQTYKMLMSNNWFSNCGKPFSSVHNISYISSKQEAINFISSYTWENICLDKLGELTLFLGENNLLGNYNNIVKYYKTHYIQSLEKNLSSLRIIRGFPKIVEDDIKMNLLSFFMYNEFKNQYYNVFFQNVCDIYIQGNLPCGYEESSDTFYVY